LDSLHFLKEEMFMSESKLRALEMELNSSPETGRLLKCSHQRAWYWRKGVFSLSGDEREKLEAYLLDKLARLNSIVEAAA
jgi:hypothetical protein